MSLTIPYEERIALWLAEGFFLAATPLQLCLQAYVHEKRAGKRKKKPFF
jgi:hypothetical protein